MCSRRLLTNTACLALGVTAAALAAQFKPLVPAPRQVRPPARVVFTATPVAPAPAVTAPLLAPETSSKPVRRFAPKSRTAKPAPAADAPGQINEPATSRREVSAQAERPPQPASEAPPPRPERVPVLPIPDGVAPGGNAVVLGLRINHAGRAEDMVVLVHSKDAFFDLAVSLQAMQTTFGPLNPPLAPGEARWITLTLYKQESASALP